MQTNEPVPNQRGTVAERAAAQLTAAPMQTFLLNVAPFTFSIFDGAGGRVDYIPDVSKLIPFQMGRALRAGVGLPTGNRPLASTLDLGVMSYATDSTYVGMVIPHPYDATQKIWRPISLPTRQLVSVSSGLTVNGRPAFYDEVGNTVTHPIGAGEFCNCYVSVGSANGLPCLISAQLYLLNSPTTANRIVGAEYMVDSAANLNSLIPYVNNGTNIPLGFFGSEGSTLTGGFPQGIMYDW